MPSLIIPPFRLLLDPAMNSAHADAFPVTDFAVDLFEHLCYIKCHRVNRTHKTTPYLICGDWRHAKVNVCLTCPTQNNILLVVREDKGLYQAARAIPGPKRDRRIRP